MKILIADDEPLVRYSLITFLCDSGLFKEDILEASNGEQFLESIRNFAIDTALVDIRMPLLDGLNAIRQARELSPDTDYYILSGFSDFNYAQEGIRLGIKDYLLKPVKKSELQKIIENTRQAIEIKKQKLLHILTFQIAEMMLGKQTDFTFPFFCYPLFITDDSLNAWQLPSDCFAELILPYQTGQGTWLFIFSARRPTICLNSITASALNHQTGHSVLEGKPFINSRNWHLELERQDNLVSILPATGHSRFYPHTFDLPDLPGEVKKLCGLCHQNVQAYIARDYTKYCLTNNVIIETFNRIPSSQKTYTQNILRYLTAVYDLNADTVSELKKQLNETAQSLLPSYAPKDLVFDSLLDYIHENYREDIGLEALASLFNLTPNYLSTLFRKKTGQNFIQYLTILRISESKRLLRESSLTIQEVGYQVGYYSCSYFIKRFAAMEGITPTEYRNQKQSSVTGKK